MKMTFLPRLKGRCGCDFCKTTRKFKRIVSKLPERERKWLMNYYDFSFEMISELEMIKANVK